METPDSLLSCFLSRSSAWETAPEAKAMVVYVYFRSNEMLQARCSLASRPVASKKKASENATQAVEIARKLGLPSLTPAREMLWES